MVPAKTPTIQAALAMTAAADQARIARGWLRRASEVMPKARPPNDGAATAVALVSSAQGTWISPELQSTSHAVKTAGTNQTNWMTANTAATGTRRCGALPVAGSYPMTLVVSSLTGDPSRVSLERR